MAEQAALVSGSPLVSIVMPSLNQRRFIGGAIESVLSQDYQPLELVVVDGQSVDGTLETLQGYGDRIRWVSERDAGQAAAINKGFRLARGEVIGWLNSDDVFVPGGIAAAVAYLVEHPEVDLVYGDADHIDVEGRVIAPYPTEPFTAARLQETCFICQPAAFFRRRVFDTIGVLDERLTCSMDYDYWIRIARRGRIGYVPRRLAQSRLHPETKTSRLRRQAQRESIEIVRLHFGTVPPSWLCAYATAVVESRMARGTGWRKGCFAVAVTLVSAWESFRVNRGIPRRALHDWSGWLGRSRQGRAAG
jgi:glycosyltransferase involved in cell wall biosynthesis